MDAPSTSTISSLSLERRYETDVSAVSRGLTSLCGGLQNLKQLKIDYEWYSKSVILYLEILQSLPMLETLDFEILAIEDYTRFSSKTLKEEDDDDIFHSKISIINTSELKSIRLLLCLDSSMFRDFFIKSNALFDFICKSCPMLEIFDLVVRNWNDSSDDSSPDSDMLDFTGSGGGFLNLDLTKQVHLKQIKIKQDICNYYTFDHEPGKSWANINVPISQESLRQVQAGGDLLYRMNLAWDTNKNVNIQLSDCQW